MSRRMVAIAIAVVLFGTMVVLNASANAPAPSDSVQPVTSAGAMYGGAPLLGTSGVMLVSTTVPVQIPGHVLQAGTYNFDLINSDNEVKISKADNSEFYGVFFVTPAGRKTARGGAQVDVAGAPNGGPARITAWYFPGQSNGYAFIYPRVKHAGTVIAKASK